MGLTNSSGHKEEWIFVVGDYRRLNSVTRVESTYLCGHSFYRPYPEMAHTQAVVSIAFFFQIEF